MIDHVILTYSHWESPNVCFSESFESLSEGLQGAVQALRGVPICHRTTRLYAEVNGLMEHYGLEKEEIQSRIANENDNEDVELPHGHLKPIEDQELMLRGTRESDGREGYSQFLNDQLQRRNLGREMHPKSEEALLRLLLVRRFESWRPVSVRVVVGSMLKVDGNAYTILSSLIGKKVDVRLRVDDIEIWYARTLMERFSQLHGQRQRSDPLSLLALCQEV